MNHRLTSLTLAICVIVSSTGMLSTRASAAMETEMVGTVADPGDPGTVKNSNICFGLQCSNDDGCSTITNRYTEWWPSGKCEHLAGGSGVQTCREYTMKCRHDIHYSGYFGGCTGTITDETTHNEPGCFSEQPSTEEPTEPSAN